MKMHNMITCSKCGRYYNEIEFETYDISVNFAEVYVSNNSSTDEFIETDGPYILDKFGNGMHLCPKCTESFIKWIEGDQDWESHEKDRTIKVLRNSLDNLTKKLNDQKKLLEDKADEELKNEVMDGLKSEVMEGLENVDPSAIKAYLLDILHMALYNGMPCGRGKHSKNGCYCDNAKREGKTNNKIDD